MGGRSRPELFGSRGEGCSLRAGTVDAGPEVDRQHHPGSGQSIAVLLLGSSPLRAEGEPARPRRPRVPSSGYLHTLRYHWHLISFAAGRPPPPPPGDACERLRAEAAPGSPAASCKHSLWNRHPGGGASARCIISVGRWWSRRIEGVSPCLAGWRCMSCAFALVRCRATVWWLCVTSDNMRASGGALSAKLCRVQR